MIPSDKEIARYCQQTFDYYTDNWGNNFPLSRRFHDDNLKKVILTTSVLKNNFERLKNIYICHTSDSTGLLYSLKTTFGCKITVLTNHPLFERMQDYYDDTLSGINYKKVDCIFDNPFKYAEEADLVLFPDMEYYVPLKTKKFLNVKQPVCCVYYVDDLNTITQQNLIDTPKEVSELFAFKQTLDFAMFKTHKERHCYCGIGTL
jgi:hypothetical protein